MTRHLSAQAVAQLIGIKTATLAKWRRQGRGPQGWFHVSTTLVVYPIEEVERFVAEPKPTASDV
jgi:transposase-like protein